MFENEQMKKQESLPSGEGWLPRGEGGVDCYKYSSQNMDEEASILGWGGGGWRVGWQIPPVKRITHILQNITFPQTFFADIKNWFFLGLNSSFESFKQKNSRHLLQNWLWEVVFLFLG